VDVLIAASAHALGGRHMKRLTSSALIVAALVLPVAARADTANHAAPSVGQTIHGTINSINGKYSLTVG
jgi:hypothetical protein